LQSFRDLDEVQRAFDGWRSVYNVERPHEALDQEVPASRYQPSVCVMPDRIPEVEYDEHEIVRTVSTTKDYIGFKGCLWKVPQVFRGERVAIRPRTPDGRYAICFGAREIANIDLTNPKGVSHVPEHPSGMSPGYTTRPGMTREGLRLLV
jgi:hypothetical protein